MDPIKDIIDKVQRTISRYGMCNPGDLCIVAVSGGPDSVCLLNILYELKEALGIKLVVAHLDHGLREGEDEAETRFVQGLASSMDLPFETEKASCLTDGTAGSVEEKARKRPMYPAREMASGATPAADREWWGSRSSSRAAINRPNRREAKVACR